MESDRYYQPDNNSQSRSLANDRDIVLSADSRKSNRTSETTILFALGFIGALLFISGMQLYRCVNLKPAAVKIIESDRALLSENKATNTQDFQ
ncbi:MAG: hypothetical protein AAGE96_05465 [Cyanobacteria bacterium P01_G01_bin.19]